VLLPYGRGDLVSRIHQEGEVLTEEHVAEGTVVRARVKAALAGELSAYAVVATPTGVTQPARRSRRQGGGGSTR
jgi:GTP-binding protein HflX